MIKKNVVSDKSIRLIAALLVFILATLNIISALTQAFPQRLHILHAAVGHDIPLIAQAQAIPVSTILLCLAWALHKGRFQAWRTSIFLLSFLVVLNAFKGLDFEEAFLCIAAIGFLVWGRNAFLVGRESRSLVNTVAAFARFALASALVSMGTLFVASTLDSQYRSFTAFADGNVDLFLHGPIGLSLLLVGTSLFLAPVRRRGLSNDQERQEMINLICTSGEDTLAPFKTRQDLEYLFHPSREAAIGFKEQSGVMIQSGDIVGERLYKQPMINLAREHAHRLDLSYAIIGADEDSAEYALAQGMEALYMGDEALLSPGPIPLQGHKNKKLRQAVNRVTRLGYTGTWKTHQQLSSQDKIALRELKEQWRGEKRPTGFSMDLDGVALDTHTMMKYLLLNEQNDRLVGFLAWAACPSSDGVKYTLAHMCALREVNGLTEWMIVESARYFDEADEDVKSLSLNFAAAAAYMRDPITVKQRTLGWIAHQTDGFFQLSGLYDFNDKFNPTWQPRYLVYEGNFNMVYVAVASLLLEAQLPKPPLIMR